MPRRKSRYRSPPRMPRTTILKVISAYGLDISPDQAASLPLEELRAIVRKQIDGLMCV